MKRFRLSAATLLCVLVLVACAASPPDDMTTVLTDDYAAIRWEERVYVPYTAFDRAQCAEQIGIVDGDPTNKVYAWRGHDKNEWIINAMDHDGAMLLREQTVTDIPEGISSEYAWNMDAVSQ